MNGTGKSPGDYQIEDFVTDESFINYFLKLDRDDEVFWEKWLSAHPRNANIAEGAKDLLRDLSLTLSEKEYREELVKLRKAINYEDPIFTGKRPVIFRLLNWQKGLASAKHNRKRYLKYLAPGLLIFVMGAYFLLRHPETGSGQLTEKYNNSAKPVVFTLSDGTVVTLAPQGVFRYPADFGNKDRKVYLDGEAEFQVSRDTSHPFKVYAGDVSATVLGTVFNIKKQPGDSVVLIELIKGKLKVETINNLNRLSQSVILNPDERVVYRGHDQKLSKEKWQSQSDAPLVNHFLFRKSNFQEIAAQLKSVFGITVINQSNKKPWRFTGEFNNTSAIDMLQSICIVEKLTYGVQGDTVFIK